MTEDNDVIQLFPTKTTVEEDMSAYLMRLSDKGIELPFAFFLSQSEEGSPFMRVFGSVTDMQMLWFAKMLEQWALEGMTLEDRKSK